MLKANGTDNSVIPVWYYSFCPDALPETQLRSCLHDTCIQLQPFRVEEQWGLGIILTAGITQAVFNFLKIVCHEDNKVLVLLMGEEPSSTDDPWAVLQTGAADLLVWGQLVDPASVISAKYIRWQEIYELENSALIKNSLIGKSHTWKSVLSRLIEVARYTDDSIVLIGETGTGKELAARLIHTLDLKRNKHDLVIQDCTNIVPDLSGSELFGHEKGAFTGAISARDGAFALADGGTLFLDEVGELPINLQIQLLRVLQEHTFKRVGSNLWRKVDFRLICATNQDLTKGQNEGKFRRDLYYRVANWIIRMPPLRERIEDIIPLAQHFIRQAHPEKKDLDLDDKIQEFLLTREYPGNVRDLKNLVFRMIARHVGPGPITIGDIPADERPSQIRKPLEADETGIEQTLRRAMATGIGLKELRKFIEETIFQIAINDTQGNLQQAAKRLKVTDRTLQKYKSSQMKDVKRIISKAN